MSGEVRKLHKPYQIYGIMMGFCLALIAFGFVMDSPGNISQGFIRILTSRSVILTDYIHVGGIGAAMLSAALTGIMTIMILIFSKVNPNGATIMAFWLVLGFAFFGKNLFNTIPLTTGVWLFSKYKREPFRNYSLNAMLVSCVSPVVSGICFLGIFNPHLEMIAGILTGLFVGFIMPSIAAYTVRLHGGYLLYNMGFAGGLVATVIASMLRDFGIDIIPSEGVSGGNNLVLGILLYTFAAAMLVLGLTLGKARENLIGLREILKRPGRLVSDFYVDQGNAIFINMGILCAFCTTVVLMIGAQLNGPVFAAIFTVVGFGSFGKHIRNVLPIMTGALLAAYFNRWDLISTGNVIAILFCTSLAPISGQFGAKWGIITGFLHVFITANVGFITGGLNLYGNGFGAGFAALFLLPLITAFGKDKRGNEN